MRFQTLEVLSVSLSELGAPEYHKAALFGVEPEGIHVIGGEDEVAHVADSVFGFVFWIDVDCLASYVVLPLVHERIHLVAVDFVHQDEHLVLLRRGVLTEDILRRFRSSVACTIDRVVLTPCTENSVDEKVEYDVLANALLPLQHNRHARNVGEVMSPAFSSRTDQDEQLRFLTSFHVSVHFSADRTDTSVFVRKVLRCFTACTTGLLC